MQSYTKTISQQNKKTFFMFYVSNYHNFNEKRMQTIYNSAYYTLFTSIRKQANLQAGTYNSAIFCIIKTMVQNTD